MKPRFSRCIRYLLSILSVVVVISLLMHPELRMLAPFLDAIGLDGLALMVCAPLFRHVRTYFLLYVAPVLSKALARLERSRPFQEFSSWAERHLSFLLREEYCGPIIALLWIRLRTPNASQGSKLS